MVVEGRVLTNNSWVLTVTADDIANGRQHSCHKCPLGIATRRAINRGWFVLVNYDEVQIYNPHTIYWFETPPFVKAFDNDRFAVEPFSIELPGEWKCWNKKSMILHEIIS